MLISFKIVFLCSLLVTGSALAAPSTSSTLAPEPVPALTLDAAISEALQKNPEYLRTTAEIRAAEWRKFEALSAHLPHLSLNASHLFNAKYEQIGINFGGQSLVLPSGFPQSLINVDASILLFDGLASIRRYQASGSLLEASQFEHSRAAFQTRQEIRLRFYQTLATHILVGVAEENIRSLQEHLDLARSMVRTGYSTRFDLLRVEALMEEALADKILAMDNETLARRELTRVMGESEDVRPIEGSLPIPNRAWVPQALKLEISQREDLTAQLRREEATERESSAAAGFWVPRISLFGMTTFYKFGDFDPGILPSTQFENSYSLGLRLSWNIFDGGASYARLQESRAAVDRDHENIRASLLRAPEDLELWKRRFIYNTALFEARKRAVQKSEESVRLAQIGLKAGTKTSTEFLDAELELFRSRAGLVRAQMDAEEALIRLELAIGHGLAKR